MNTPSFPNGFESWQKTHFEVVEVLCYMRELDDEHVKKGFSSIADKSASDDLYRLALDLTNLFEEKTKGQVRNRSLFDEIEDFVWQEVKDR